MHEWGFVFLADKFQICVDLVDGVHRLYKIYVIPIKIHAIKAGVIDSVDVELAF